MMNDTKILFTSYKPTLIHKLRWKLQSLKYKIKNIPYKIGITLIRKSIKGSTYLKHAKNEFKVLNWPGGCEMQELICQNMIDLLSMFSNQEHSGSTAPYVVRHFEKLADFKPISPLTGEDSEWDKCWGEGTYQNNRCRRVFKKVEKRPTNFLRKVTQGSGNLQADMSYIYLLADAMRKHIGKAYDINGKVFKESDGCCYTNKDSRVYIDFPYTPKTEYVKV